MMCARCYVPPLSLSLVTLHRTAPHLSSRAGLINDPELNGTFQINKGLKLYVLRIRPCPPLQLQPPPSCVALLRVLCCSVHLATWYYCVCRRDHAFKLHSCIIIDRTRRTYSNPLHAPCTFSPAWWFHMLIRFVVFGFFSVSFFVFAFFVYHYPSSSTTTRARKLLIEINEMGIGCAVEFLDTISPQYIADLISWGAIGARTTESQVHRELASGLSCPIGFKNGTGGSIQIAVDAVKASKRGHRFLSVTKQGLSAIVHTRGNPYSHLILRGGKDGRVQP